MVWVGAVLLVVFVFALLCALWVVWLVVMLFVFALWFDRFNSVVTCDSLCLYVCAFCCPVMVAICCRAGLGCWFLFWVGFATFRIGLLMLVRVFGGWWLRSPGSGVGGHIYQLWIWL